MAKVILIQESTVYAHFSKLIEEEKVKIEDVLDQKRIELLNDKLGKELEGTLTELKNKAGRCYLWRIESV